MARAAVILLPALLPLALAATGHTAEPPRRPCFDFSTTITEPLHPPIPMTGGRDNSVTGTYSDGVSWAGTRATLAMPITELYRKLLDHRNHKDMRKTKLSTRSVERPGYLEFQIVDIVVTVRAVLFKVKIAWSEEWGFVLVEGTREAPRRIVASYQKVDGTTHLKHQCGSYVLQAIDDGSADLSMYDEVLADRRDAEDTRRMQAGILEKLRGQGP
jgi:hypothetical protein